MLSGFSGGGSGAGRWAPRIAELLSTYMYATSPQDVSKYQYSPAIRALLTKYHTKLQNPQRKSTRPTFKQSIYANNYLNLGDVHVIGFDLDYTLVPYTVELQSLIFTMARDILVSAYGFPKELKTCFFDPNFAIRGLSVDTRNGMLVKLNQIQRVGARYAYLGKRPVSNEELNQFYGQHRHISQDDLSRLRPLHDLFSMAEACLIADSMEVFEYAKRNRNEPYIASAIIDDVQAAIRDVHISGDMHNAVVQDLDRFVKLNPQLPDLLLHLKRSGKQLFLATNSGFKYADQALSYAIGCSPSSSTSTFNSKGHVISCDWQEFFDVTICNALKPDFFSSRKPFRKWNVETNRPSTLPVGDLKATEVYVNGSVHALQRSKPLWLGKNVMYVGDNLRADIIEARRIHGWHTAAIIDELDREIDIQSTPWFSELHFLRSTLRNLISDIQLAMMQDMRTFVTTQAQQETTGLASQIHHMDVLLHDYYTTAKDDDEVLKSIERELQSINVELSSLFNPQFGSMFRTDGHPSLYAFAVRRYSDLYMTEVCNLLNYSANHRFYPSHALHMAHDPIYA